MTSIACDWKTRPSEMERLWLWRIYRAFDEMTSFASVLIVFRSSRRACQRLNTNLCAFSCAVTRIERPAAQPTDHVSAGQEHFRDIKTPRWAMFAFLFLDSVFIQGHAPHLHLWTLWLAHRDPDTIKGVRVRKRIPLQPLRPILSRTVQSPLHAPQREN